MSSRATDDVREETRKLDVLQQPQGQRMRWPHYLTVALCFLVLMLEGLAFSSLAVAAPALLPALHLEKSSLGWLFGAASVGALLASVPLSRIGDRFGRRIIIIWTLLLYTLPLFAMAWARSVESFFVLQLLVGVGAGGVVPNVLALLSELMPPPVRKGVTTVALMGVFTGNAAAGMIGAYLIPQFGWRIIFLLGGAVGVVLSVAPMLFLPESIKFLLIARPTSPELTSLTTRFAPPAPLDIHFQEKLSPPVSREHQSFRAFLRVVLQGRRKSVTLLVWLAFFFESLAFSALTYWIPVLLVGAGISHVHASFTYSYFNIGCIPTILVIAKVLDKNAPLTTAALAGVAFTVAAAFGVVATTEGSRIAMATLILVFAGGTHVALMGTVGSLYPTAVRASGVGSAISWGRLGLSVGPIAAGYLIVGKMSLGAELLWCLLPYLMVVGTSLALVPRALTVEE